ncbi:zinc knuckle CX2CX4HX4C containing protein [Tanacetum coccineum]|uniref:Zinc knuckle CX2CX4HX4C containing protein n=1 Tax=Tanacetum coccineum TaxID=301880 RepID=A0ABQ5ASP6_9ASTR
MEFFWQRLVLPVVALTISMDGLDAMLEYGPWFIRNNPLILKKWYPNVNLLKEDVGWKPPRCACCKVFGHVLDECPNNIDSDVVKNNKKGLVNSIEVVLVDPKVGFKPVKQVYRQVARKNNVNTNGNKKKDAEPTIEVSNSNPFDVLNSVENDVDLGTNGGSPNLTSSKVNTSGFLSGNVESSSTSNTLMVEKIDKMKRLIIEGKVTLVDDEESYMNGDYDFDPYGDDMYEGQDIPNKI